MGETNYPSVAHVGYDTSSLQRVKLKNLTTSRHGQLKENLFIPLFNTNFISKFEINAGKRHETF